MWLLSPEKASEIRAAVSQGAVPTAQERANYVAAEHAAESAAVATANMPRNMKVAGSTAEIRVEGILTEKPDFLAWLFGGGNTTYGQIQAALAVAAADPAVKNIVLDVNSPGGTVAGLFETLAALEAFPKDIRVRASQADSAAYAIAVVAGPIEAKTMASEFGSIGVATAFFVDDEVVDITSTEAPNKRPDISTDEGKAVVREHLDAIHELFVDAIASARGTSPKTVNETFGRGSVLLAAEAKSRGMIDKIPARKSAKKSAAAVADATETDASAEHGGAEETETEEMDMKQLRTQHPELVEAVRQEGIEAGKTKERDRVTAHIVYGEQCGAMDIAIGAIRDGSEMTQTLTAQYMTAGRNRADIEARQQESAEAEGALKGAKNTEEAMDEMDVATAEYMKLYGKKGG